MVQPVATCRQSPYDHKPAIFKLLLLIYSFQFRSAFGATTAPSQPQIRRPLPSQTHQRCRHIPELICEINSSIDLPLPDLLGSRLQFAAWIVNLARKRHDEEWELSVLFLWHNGGQRRVHLGKAQ